MSIMTEAAYSFLKLFPAWNYRVFALWKTAIYGFLIRFKEYLNVFISPLKSSRSVLL